MREAKNRRAGFTLVELLTVIAIIALLTALLFPVFSSARASARRTTCMSQMHSIWVALKQYDADNNKYPAALLGYVQVPGGSFYTGTGTPATFSQLTYVPLTTGQKYLKDKAIFQCPDNAVKDPTKTTTVVYPPTAGASLANQPVNYTDLIKHNVGDNSGVPVGSPAYYYPYDSYDVGPQVDKNGNVASPPIQEVHYSLDWTGGSGPDDNPNQLKYPNAPDSTIVTWCTHHAATAHANLIPVLTLGGTVKVAPVGAFITQGPLNFKF